MSRKYWTPAEDRVIRDEYRYGTAAVQRYLPYRTRKQIYRRASRLGVTGLSGPYRRTQRQSSKPRAFCAVAGWGA